MHLRSGYQCIRIIFWCLNLIFTAIGIAIMAVGIYALLQYNQLPAFSDSTLKGGIAVAVAAGCLIIVIAGLGCCGAWAGNTCVLLLYTVILAIITAIEITAGIIGYVYRDTVRNYATRFISQVMSDYGNGHNATITTVNEVQQKFHCCGATTIASWYNSSFANGKPIVPDSCCVSMAKNCGKQGNITNIYNTGCLTKFIDYSKRNLLAIGGISLAVALLQILGIIFSCCLCREFHRQSAYTKVKLSVKGGQDVEAKIKIKNRGCLPC
ncbi:CD63 antigen [Trichoplax sp. H2]|nr:CD63 antigen [Trichoplax sp. H2]|eukprot:RDD39605.1 CD63 antigen [Trichoplax sp. H2]